MNIRWFMLLPCEIAGTAGPMRVAVDVAVYWHLLATFWMTTGSLFFVGWKAVLLVTCNDLHTRVHRDTNVRNMYIQISYLHLYTSYTLLYYINLTLSV